MAAAVHLRPLHSLAPPLHLPFPAARSAPNWPPFPGKARARRRGSSSRLTLFVCSASTPEPSGGGKAREAAASAAARWAEWIPRTVAGGVGPEQVLRLISGAAATPVCQFVDSPRTFLHAVDPRVKLVWLLALVVLPARSNIYMRFGLVIFLALLSVWVLPNHVWKDQLGRVALLSGIIFIMLGFGSDGVPSLVQTRTPPPSVLGIPSIPCSTSGYSYTIMKLGPLQFTRKGLSVASTSASLSFAIFQSASLCLTTTTPEQLASALWWFVIPLKHIGVPVPEIILTLLLSLRFINLVFDEVRNSALAIVARRINWKMLTAMETIDIFFNYVQRIFKNIFDHSEQISKAMIARGFRGDPSNHKIYFLTESSFGIVDLFSLLCLFALMGLASFSDQLV
ncbi:protein ABCI12, chloroplastic-like [Phragmites australis]|uniref:protein ABCI12, chloroplastic-like n=1 Tax=Phragmites australis TaxID=29695 RepID=UPI002D79C260|nr:protein ABCI12, chloroplastic-like [Phragmites australis]